MNQAKAAKEEFFAVTKLLNRSSIHSIPTQFFARHLSTSLRLFEKQETRKDSGVSKKDQTPESSSNDKKPEENANKQSNQNDKDQRKKKNKSIEDKDRENYTNKAIGYLTKTILWVSLIYSIIFTIWVVVSILSGDRGGSGSIKDSGANSESFIVSWKEFIQYMLATGEVKEIIIRPQYDYVRVILHDGAIINGRRPRFSSYMLSVPNTERFEQRLREVEKAMGIAEGNLKKNKNNIEAITSIILNTTRIKSILGVAIRYERFSELYFKLFAGAVACAILYAIIKRLPSAASSATKESFVSLSFTIFVTKEILKSV